MQLWFMLDHGEIDALEHHPRFPILVSDTRSGKPVQAGVYEADSSYRRDGELVVEDFKPKSVKAQDPVFKLHSCLVKNVLSL